MAFNYFACTTCETSPSVVLTSVIMRKSFPQPLFILWASFSYHPKQYAGLPLKLELSNFANEIWNANLTIPWKWTVFVVVFSLWMPGLAQTWKQWQETTSWYKVCSSLSTGGFWKQLYLTRNSLGGVQCVEKIDHIWAEGVQLIQSIELWL